MDLAEALFLQLWRQQASQACKPIQAGQLMPETTAAQLLFPSRPSLAHRWVL